MRKIHLYVLLATTLCAAAGLSPAVSAEVVDSAANGFTSRNTATVAAPAGEVFSTLVNRIGLWWHPSHTYTGDAANLRIEPRPQGCFCETLPGGGGVRHLTVVYLDPGKTLRLTGGLGPLQGQAVSGALTWSLEEGEDGESTTTITATYAVHGYAPDGLDGWAGAVDGVIRQQLERLARFVETGSPEGVEADAEQEAAGTGS